MKKLIKAIIYLPRKVGQGLIRFYQKTLSPDHSWIRHIFPGGFCRFSPSCSDYTHAAIGKYGLIRGSFKGFWRILRCNPWNKGGLDMP